MLKKILPVLVLAALFAIGWMVKNNPPEVKRQHKQPEASMVVQVQKLRPENYQVRVQRTAQIQSALLSQLVSQANGQIVWVSENFTTGASFSMNETLVQLEDSEYRNEVAIQQAVLTEALQALEEEKAQVEQALKAWKISGRSGEPNDRIKRVPQLKAAQAKVQSARASLRRATENLQKTKIVAPFNGTVVSTAANLGQYVNTGTSLAQLESSQPPELRIALNQRELSYIDLPKIGQNGAQLRVLLHGQTSTNQAEITGFITHVETALNSSTQQLMVLAQLDHSASNVELLSGQYVQCVIIGRQLDNVLVVPNSAIYQGTYVYLVSDGVLKRRDITLGWQDEEFSIVTSGLDEGEQLVLTPLGQVTSGTLVKVRDQNNANQSASKQPQPEVDA